MQQSQAQMAETLSKINERSREHSLVDSRGVGKPEVLSNRTTGDATAFETWRVKFSNWICAAMPPAQTILGKLETDSTEFTLDAFEKLSQEHPGSQQLSAQLRATLVSVCAEEPLKIVLHGPRGKQSALEALRRINYRYDPTGPRSAKSALQKMMATGAVTLSELNSAVATLEKQFEDYRSRSGREVPEDIRMVVLEQLLAEPLKTHCSLNWERLATYELLRAEIVKYAERTRQDNLLT